MTRGDACGYGSRGENRKALINSQHSMQVKLSIQYILQTVYRLWTYQNLEENQQLANDSKSQRIY
jgi:hypothetical protein